MIFSLLVCRPIGRRTCFFGDGTPAVRRRNLRRRRSGRALGKSPAFPNRRGAPCRGLLPVQSAKRRGRSIAGSSPFRRRTAGCHRSCISLFAHAPSCLTSGKENRRLSAPSRKQLLLFGFSLFVCLKTGFIFSGKEQKQEKTAVSGGFFEKKRILFDISIDKEEPL